MNTSLTWVLCCWVEAFATESYQDLVYLSAIEEPRIGGLGQIALSIHDKRVYRLYLREVRFGGKT